MSAEPRPVRVHRRVPAWQQQLEQQRRPGLRRRLALRTGATALVIAALAIGSEISGHTPAVDAQQKPFIRTGVVGTAIDARTFAATVLGVRGAAIISQDEATHDTSGVWVIVRIRLTARTDPVSLGYAAVVDARGRVYRATGRIDQSLLGGRTLQPGVPVVGEIAFEVPVSVAAGLSIQLSASPLDRRMDVLAQIRLPIGAGQAKQWRTQTKPIAVDAPEVAK